jgi:hypothetical protein
MTAPPGLKSLTTDAGPLSPGFSTGRRAYHLRVAHEVASLRLIPEPVVAETPVTVAGVPVPAGEPSAPVALSIGRNRVVVEVAAAAETIAYTVTVVRGHATPDWVRAVEHGPFTARDSAGELVFNGRMWLFGGYTPGLVSDVWSSPDGICWRPEDAIPSSAGINIPVAWAHADRMWVASSDGRLFSSPNGADWTLVCEDPPWKGRYATGCAVFRDRMWALGGMGNGRVWNDLWSSTDGRSWTLECEAASWSARQLFANVVVHDDQLWVLGGGITSYHPFRAYTDVWRSPDGRSWTRVTEAAPWPARIWSSAVSYRGRLWLFSGFRSEPTWTNLDDVWYSTDGQDWHRLVTDHVWSARHELSPYVHQDRLWVVAGNAWPLQDDAWFLEIPGLCFLTQPLVEEFSGARYCYRARADFNASRAPVRYRLVDGPEWLTVDEEAGVVSGTPPAPGEHPVSLLAYDPAGETARQEWVLHVLPIG